MSLLIDVITSWEIVELCNLLIFSIVLSTFLVSNDSNNPITLLDKSKAEKTENDKIFVEKSKHPLSLSEVDEIIDTLSSMELNNKTMLNYLSQVEQKKKDKVEVM